MNLSFHEKSLWLMLAALLLSFGWYFGIVLPEHLGLVQSAERPRSLTIHPTQVTLFGLAVAMAVGVSVVGHVCIALVDRRTDTDERDQLIALRGARLGSVVLACSVFLALVTAVLTRGNFAFAHVLLLGWVLAQVVEIVSQLWLYRHGLQ